MLNENHNNPDWKNRLNELEGLPGEGLDKTALWEKLHYRLSERRSNKKARWYWFAAACLLLTVVMSWLLIVDNQVPLVKNNIGQEKGNTTISKIPPADNKEMIFEPVQTAKKHHKTNFLQNKKESSITPKNIAAPDATIAQAEIIEQQEIAARSIDTVAVASTPTAKKKLRVVHINELDNRVVQQLPFARNNTEYLSHPEPFTNDVSGGFSRNASDNILKIKLSPSN